MSEPGAEMPRPIEYTPYHSDLAQRYPVDRLKIKDRLHTDMLTDGSVVPSELLRLLNFPQGKEKSAALVGTLVMNAVRTNDWTDMISPKDDNLSTIIIQPIDTEALSSEIRHIHATYKDVVDEVVTNGWAAEVRINNRILLQPTEGLCELLKEKIGFEDPEANLRP